MTISARLRRAGRASSGASAGMTLRGGAYVALILGRQEPGRRAVVGPTREERDAEEHEQHRPPDFEEVADRPSVAVLDRLVDGVELPGEPVRPALSRLEPCGALGGFEREGVDRTQERRRRDGQRELPVELARDPAEERGRMNTAMRTNVIAMTGPVTSSIALTVAARGASPFSMWCEECPLHDPLALFDVCGHNHRCGVRRCC